MVTLEASVGAKKRVVCVCVTEVYSSMASPWLSSVAADDAVTVSGCLPYEVGFLVQTLWHILP